jgi:methionyl-tRNA formyltransferase
VKIVFVTQGINSVLKILASSLGDNLIGVVESAPRDYASSKKINFKSFPLLLFCRRKKIKYLLMHRINSDYALNWLSQQSPDLVIVYSMSQLLPEKFLAIPRFGCVNLHPSLLPAYRGPNPFFWMYYNQEKLGGVTLHFIDPGEDTGDIIDQRSYAIPLGMRFPDMQKCAIDELGLNMIMELIQKFHTGQPLPRHEQPIDSPTRRARNIHASEHISLINWSEWPIERIWHIMRGTELWLDCIEQPSGLLKGLRWTVLDFKKSQIYAAKPHLWGSVVRVGKSFHVPCRDGFIEIAVCLSAKTLLKMFAKRFYGKF